jgi:flagellar biosynthesis protein FliR
MSSSQEHLLYAALALRCFGFIVSLPLGEALSNFPRFLLAVGLAVALHPVAKVSGELSALSLVVEFVIGFVLGAPLRFVVDVSEMVGELIDTSRGQTISAVLDPLHGQGNSDLAVLAKNGAVVCALTVGALEVSLGGLVRSVSAVPIGTLVQDEVLVQGLLKAALFLLVEAMRICAVWIGVFLLIDLGCAIASRLVSGLSFSQSGSVLKMIVTFVLLMVFMSEGGRLSVEDLKRAIVPWRSLVWEPLNRTQGLPALGGPAGTPTSLPGGPDER